jgi:hypothetical protein
MEQKICQYDLLRLFNVYLIREALKNVKEAILSYLEPVEDDINYSPDSEIVKISL